MPSSPKRYYVTKYALTQGVLRYPASHCRINNGYLYIGSNWVMQVAPKRWFTDEKSALADAEALREKKLASLLKQLKKVSEMQIKVVTPDV